MLLEWLSHASLQCTRLPRNDPFKEQNYLVHGDDGVAGDTGARHRRRFAVALSRFCPSSF